MWILSLVVNCGKKRRKMRRRPAEYRRPIRRRFSGWIWALFGLFSIAGLVLFVLHHNQREDRVEQPVLVRIQRNLMLLYCYLSLSHLLFGFKCSRVLNLLRFYDTQLIVEHLNLICLLKFGLNG